MFFFFILFFLSAVCITSWIRKFVPIQRHFISILYAKNIKKNIQLYFCWGGDFLKKLIFNFNLLFQLKRWGEGGVISKVYIWLLPSNSKITMWDKLWKPNLMFWNISRREEREKENIPPPPPHIKMYTGYIDTQHQNMYQSHVHISNSATFLNKTL